MKKPTNGTQNPSSIGNIITRPAYDIGIFGVFKKNAKKKKARKIANASRNINRK
jgi:hypothetical protein